MPVNLCGHPPKSWNNDLFTVSHKADGTQDSVNLRAVLDAKFKFATFTNESFRETYADMQMMLELRRRDQEHLADAVWRGQLLPLGHVVHDCIAGDYMMVVEAG